MSQDHRKPSRYNQQFFRQWGGPGPLFFGLVALAVVVIGLWLAFTKSIPFTSHGYQVQATFRNAVNIAIKSPVRIAGVNVGKVTDLEQKGDNTVVTFTVDDEGRPVREDAAAQIRPRLFLEGNWFIDLDPGTPESKEMPDNGMIPVSHTATSVQVGDLLRTLQTPERANIQRLLSSLGTGLNAKPTAEQDLTFEPFVQGLSGGEALNLAYRQGEVAARGTAIVNEATLGTQPNDLGNLLRGLSRVTGAVDERGDDLQGLVTNFATFTGALAAESENLGLTIQKLGPTLVVARRSLTSLNASLPALRGFAIASTPGLNELPRTIRVTTPLLRQLQKLLTKPELAGLTQILKNSTPAAARSGAATLKLLPQLRSFGLCIADTISPTGDQVIQDGSFTNGQKASREFFYAAVSTTGSTNGLDGNGSFARIQGGGGPVTVKMNDDEGVTVGSKVLYGRLQSAPLGTSPLAPGTPPIVKDQPCSEQEIPDLNGPMAGPGAPLPVAYP
ncbi:MAG: MCE family protein [Solirubrobacterales bacterium]|nr:MCE family protein [Solirubrobacterales bacterium]HRV59288.1 MlaD family protein [Solirubrobacterales bacterium]